MRRAAFAVALPAAVLALAVCAPESQSSSLSAIERVSWSADGRWIAVKGMPDYGFGLAVARADGGGVRTPAIHGEYARWSPDGSRIADASGYSLLVATVANGTLKTVSGPNRSVASFAWSPDSEQLVYERDEGLLVQGLFVARWDGTQQRALTGGRDPAWSPDGRDIAFGRWSAWGCQYDSEIAIVGSDGSGERTLAGGPEGRVGPVWSPDGSRLAYRGACSGAIYVIRPDGSGERVVGQAPPSSFYGNPVAWSPDGEWLGVHGLYQDATTLFQVDGSGRASFRTAPAGVVNWSPQGDRILFSRHTDLGVKLFVGATDGSERAVGPGLAADWSPDGTKIAAIQTIDFEHVRYSSCTEQLLVEDLSGHVLYGVTPCRHDGTQRADVIVGTPGPDFAFGGGGTDRIYGGLGNDLLSGGDGGDRLYGGAGRDTIKAGGGPDRIWARDGVSDRVSCGAGKDVVVADSLDLVDGNCESVQHR
jgi:Tol biopolymer transport system component